MDRAARDGQVSRVISLEGLANVLVLALKTAVGLSVGSMAILADALHSLTDVANNVIAWIVVRASRQPADRKHPYGHQKFEVLAVFVLATLLAVIAVEVAIRAFTRGEPEVETSAWGLGLMIGVLVVNVALSTWERAWAKRLKSPILHADASHTFSDVLITLTVIVGWQLSARGIAWLDTVCALGVAVMILYLAFGLFRRVVPVLVDEVAVEPEAVTAALQSVSGVEEVRRVRSRWIGPDRAIDAIITVRPGITVGESHAIADRVEHALAEKFDAIDVTVHVEPHE
ncbi:MAG: cation diffusion facilitator family transporter [Gammaproteobacteria bacterium]